MTEAIELSVVLPVYCESDHLESSLRVIDDSLQDLCIEYEIICVDDGSVDGTWDQLERSLSGLPKLRAMKLSRNFGKEYAILAGLESSCGDAVIVMDCDLQHPPELIGVMHSLWRRGRYKVVDGVKKQANRGSWIAEVSANTFYSLFERLTGTDLANSSDFKLLDRDVVEAYLQLPERRLFFRGIIAWMGFTKTSVTFEVPERVAGTSKFSASRLIRMATETIISFSEALLQAATAMGALFFLFSLCLGLHTCYQKFTGHAVEGFTTVILIELLVGSAVLLGLGVIGLYIASIHHELKARPRYIVECERTATQKTIPMKRQHAA